MTKLKPYMGYGRIGGSCEGAILIFAHNIKEAKRLGWRVISEWITDEYTDMAVKLLKNGGILFEQAPEWSKEKLRAGLPHIVDDPLSCKECGLWGDELNEDGYCKDCAPENNKGGD